MVLERIISPRQMEGYPWELFLIGILYSNVGMIAAYLLVREFASLTAIAFTVILTLPFVYYSLSTEDDKYSKIRDESTLIQTHMVTFKKFLYLFFGFTLTFFTWYVLAPESVMSYLFQSQVVTIRSINNFVTGNFSVMSSFIMIFSHNVKVLIVCVLLSFFFGSGAVYIITWNASVLGVGMGTKVREGLAAAAKEFGASGLVRYFAGAQLNFLAYLIHGVPEIFAYIIGGVMGGTLSFAYIRGELRTNMRVRIFNDMVIMLLIAVGLLVAASLLEVTVTPYFL